MNNKQFSNILKKVNNAINCLDLSSSNLYLLTEHQWIELSWALENNNTVTRLDLSDNQLNHFGQCDLKTIAAFSVVIFQLAEIDLSSNFIDLIVIKDLAYFLKKSTGRLKKINLAHNLIDKNEAALLGASLKNNEFLEVLDLSSNPLGNGLAINLMTSLFENKALKTLKLHKTTITDLEVQFIAEALKTNNTLKILDISDTPTTNAGIMLFSQILSENKTLESLNISGIAIQDSTAHLLSNALSQNTSLQSLAIEQCGLTADSLEILKPGLSDQRKLKRLYLGNNPIGDKGAAILWALLIKKEWSLLSLPNCEITQEGLNTLALSVKDHLYLQYLNLSNNPIENLGGSFLALILEENKSLEHLILMNCALAEKGVAQLAQSIEFNVNLVTLDLSFNRQLYEDMIKISQSLLRNQSLNQKKALMSSLHHSLISYYLCFKLNLPKDIAKIIAALAAFTEPLMLMRFLKASLFHKTLNSLFPQGFLEDNQQTFAYCASKREQHHNHQVIFSSPLSEKTLDKRAAQKTHDKRAAVKISA